jgi:hypothetical protein
MVSIRTGLPLLDIRRDLRFAVGADPRKNVFLPHFGQTAGQAVGQHDRHRHQFRRFVRGVAEHQPLVARAAGIDSHRDVAGLLVNGGEDRTGVVVESP